MSHMQWQWTSKINLLDDVATAVELSGRGASRYWLKPVLTNSKTNTHSGYSVVLVA